MRLTTRWLAPAGVLLAALVVRLWEIDLTRFFNDQVWFIQSAANFVDSARLPLSSGLTFAVGTTGAPVRHPPLVTWLLAAPVLFSRNPVWVSGCVAALDALAAPIVYLTARAMSGRTLVGVAAGLVYALNPAAIVYGRMIWNVDLVPVFASIGLWGLVDFTLRARTWSLALSLAAIGCATELHPVNAVLLVVWLAVAVAYRLKLRPRPLAFGSLGLLATIAPYLYLQTQSGWSDVRNLLSYMGRPKATDLSALDQAAALLGPATFDRLLPPATPGPSLLGFDPLTLVLVGLAAAGLALSWGHLRATRVVLAAWFLVPIAASLRHTGDVVPHYLLAILPAAAVLVGLAFGHIASALRSGAIIAGALLVGLGAWLAVDYASFQRNVARNIRQVPYGMPLRYSLAAAELVRSRVAGQPMYLAVPFLWDQTVPALAGQQNYHWYWDHSVFVFPRGSAWYLVQNDSFGHELLGRHFGPPAATVPSSSGAPEFSLFELPEDAAGQVFRGPNLVRMEGSPSGPVILREVLPERLAAGQPSRVYLLWQIVDPRGTSSHLSQFAHLVNQDGEVVSTDPDIYDIQEPWQAGDLVASAFDLRIKPDTPAGGYWLETGFYDTFSQRPFGDNQRIGPLKVGSPAPRASTGPALATFGDGEIALLRAEWRGQSVALDWAALKTPQASYTIFVHAVDSAGKLVAQWDGQPLKGSYPTSLWDPGEVVSDAYPLGLAPTAGVHLEIGMYTQPDVRRLAVRQAGRAPSDYVLIQP